MIITHIKGTEDTSFWRAEVYNRDNMLTETYESLTYEAIDKLNGDETVSIIKATGDTPLASAESMSLVLIDTPDSNNSRDLEYRKM